MVFVVLLSDLKKKYLYKQVANNLKKILYISIFSSLISCTSLFLPKTQTEIEKEYLRIEKSKKILIDSVILKRGIDYNRGNNVDIKKYRVFREKTELKKIEYEEFGSIGDNSREWNKKTTLYLKNDIPFYIIEKLDGKVILYTNEGEKSEPMKTAEQIYIYDWNNNNIKRVRNGIAVTNQMELCKICYKELIE